VADYRLQTLLDLRERAEQEAKEAFARALAALAEAKQELKQLEDDLAKRQAERARKVKAYLEELMAKGGAALAVQGMGVYEKRLRAEEDEVAAKIEEQKLAVREAEAEAERKRSELADAAKEKKAIEKHKEEWAETVKRERAVREEQASEEIGNALYLANKRKQGDG
jgi:flagellar export protein FliJ